MYSFSCQLLSYFNCSPHFSSSSSLLPSSSSPPDHQSLPQNLMPPDPNHPPPTQPLQLCIPPCWCQLLNEVRRARVCVHVCAKGSGSVARTMGTSTAFCSDTLSPEPCSKHHGKTIKSFSKPLLLCVCFARSLCPSVPLSLHLPVPPSPSRPLFEDLRSGLSLFLNWKQIFSFSTWDVSYRQSTTGVSSFSPNPTVWRLPAFVHLHLSVQ